MEVKIIGQMDNTIDHTFESANRVYDKNGISPTINTCGGGGLQPKVIDAQAIRMVRTEEGKALRKDYENGTIHHGFNEHREMELRTDGVSNTLTSVQKDNLVLEKNIPCKLNKMPDGHLDSMENAKVCDINTPTSSTVTARYYKGIGAHKDNMIMDKIAIKQATKQGYIECEVGGVADFSYPDSKTRRGRVQDNGDTCPTLMAGEQDICRIESVCAIDEQNMNVRNETFGTLTTDGSSPKHNNRVMEYTETQYRIRKLTPMECWRLMDFTDEDFHNAEQVNSNTQLYKQAGNSIIRNVLVAIFGQMLDGKEDVYKEINSTHFPNQQQ